VSSWSISAATLWISAIFSVGCLTTVGCSLRRPFILWVVYEERVCGTSVPFPSFPFLSMRVRPGNAGSATCRCRVAGGWGGGGRERTWFLGAGAAELFWVMGSKLIINCYYDDHALRPGIPRILSLQDRSSRAHPSVGGTRTLSSTRMFWFHSSVCPIIHNAVVSVAYRVLIQSFRCPFIQNTAYSLSTDRRFESSLLYVQSTGPPVPASMHLVNCVWNVLAHARKPDFARSGRVHLNLPVGRQFGGLLAA